MSWPVWLASGPSCDSTRREILVEGPIQRRFVVRPLGRQLHLRNQRGVVRTGNGFADRARLLPARRGLAAHCAKGRRQLRGVACQLRNAVDERAGPEYGVAYRMGMDRIACSDGCE